MASLWQMQQELPSNERKLGGIALASGEYQNGVVLVGAVDDMNAALQALADAQRSGDFAAQGQALADLQEAVTAYQQAQAAQGSG